MDDQFEEDLKKRISEVFDKYQDNSADEGWQRLREKFPDEAKMRPVAWLWWSSAAAVLLILIGILWFRQAPEKSGQFNAANKTETAVQQPKATPGTSAQKPVKTDGTIQPAQSLAANNQSAVAPVKRIGKAQPGTTANSSVRYTNKANNQQQDNGALVAANKASHTNQNSVNPSNSAELAAVKPTDNNANNTGNAITAVKPADNNAINTGNTIASVKPNAGETQTTNPGNIAPAGNNVLQNKPNNQALAYSNVQSQKGLPGDKRVRFGVYAASFFNYAKGSSSQFNIGAGITSDIRLTKNLKLSTGVAIAQNSLSYGGQPSFAVPQGINMAPLALYSANTLQYSLSEPSFKSYNASLVGIDIPINLKYTFDPGKTETYLLAGLSSGTFLNETYTYYFNGAPAQNLPHTSPGGFYFGKMLNLAVGTGYRFGSNRLIIEPFLKYPLDGMGAQQLRFGSGGVNLKFNIPSIRK